MKGVINKGIQELVEERFGEDVWELVKQRAGCEEPFFATSDDYPDAMTLALVAAASEVARVPPETLMVEFGRFWVPNTGKRSYPALFRLAGRSAREFLANMDRVHELATSALKNASPPRFEYEDRPNGDLVIHYRSKRGLCAVLRGLVLGVGELFGESVSVREEGCVHKGAEFCTIVVSFP